MYRLSVSCFFYYSFCLERNACYSEEFLKSSIIYGYSDVLGARLQWGKQLKWCPTLMDLKIGFIFMDNIANFGYSGEQNFGYESFQGSIKSIAKIHNHK